MEDNLTTEEFREQNLQVLKDILDVLQLIKNDLNRMENDLDRLSDKIS